MERRFGELRFSTRILEQEINTIAELLSKIQFVPLRVEHMLIYDELVMEGYSKEFNLLEEGECFPKYSFEIERTSTGLNYRLIKKE